MDKRTNADWLAAISHAGDDRENALADLDDLLRKYLPGALNRWLASNDPRFNALVDETVQETLLRVLQHYPAFEGRSQFTTWVFKIAVRVALTDLRRRRWKNISLDEIEAGWDEEGPEIHVAIDPVAQPERLAEQNDVVRRVEAIMNDVLTPRQREVLVMVGVHGLPGDQVAAMLKTNRNALYKMMHDARSRLKQRLEAEGLTTDEIISAFSQQ
ncbi:MAG: RNA polymerase sigma factor [Anaerolineae bacterium]|nr:RNA polymerase sigma factor [Anaerolineae bacterium]